MKKYKLYIFIPIPFIIIGSIFFILYKKPLYIISTDREVKTMDLVLSGYTDKGANGNSIIEFMKDASGKISYKYMLKEGTPYPYIGIQLSKKDSTLFDLTPFNYVKIKIRSSLGTRVPITLTSNIQGFSKKEVELSYRTSQYVLIVDKKTTELYVSIKEFETPNWWYNTNNITEKVIKGPDFSKVKTIQLNNCINLKPNIADLIEVEEISFHSDLKLFYIFSGIFALLYYSIGLMVLYRKAKVTKTEINFQYDKTDVVNQKDKDEEAIFGFITSNYSKEELTIIDIQQAIGIHERKISGIIKNKTDLNFKQFLNKLRISEAKRLLSTTNLQISEIAFKVGYSNASHFNRVFKSLENCSPNDFRKEHPLS